MYDRMTEDKLAEQADLVTDFGAEEEPETGLTEEEIEEIPF